MFEIFWDISAKVLQAVAMPILGLVFRTRIADES